MGQTVSPLGNHAIAVCGAAKRVLKKAPGGFRFGGGDHDPDEQDQGCPACGASQHGVYAGANARDLLPLPALPDLPEKPKKKEEAKPAAQICGCATPRPCRCAPVPCACACSCKTASAPAPAHP